MTALMRLLPLLMLILPAAAVADDSDLGNQGPTTVLTELDMYVLPQCGYCERARGHLRSRGVTWRELDIENSPEANRAFVALGGGGVPVLVLGNQRVRGFNPERIDVLLKSAGLLAPSGPQATPE